MNKVEMLLKADLGKINEIPQVEINSARLTYLLGENTKIKVRAIDKQSLMSQIEKINEVGEEEKVEIYETVASMGIVDPDLSDINLKKKLELNENASPLDVFKKLWKHMELESITITKKICELSGVDVKIDDVKN